MPCALPRGQSRGLPPGLDRCAEHIRSPDPIDALISSVMVAGAGSCAFEAVSAVLTISAVSPTMREIRFLTVIGQTISTAKL